jgi:hypothetical protein
MNKMFKVALTIGAIFTLVSCGEKDVTRDEAITDLGNMYNKDISEPDKYTFTTTTNASSTTTNLKNMTTATESATNTISYSLNDHYFSIETTNVEFKIVLFEKDNVLNLYTDLYGVKGTIKIDISFVEEMKVLAEQYQFSLIGTIKDFYKSFANTFLPKFASFTADQGLEEKYTTTGDGNLSIYYKYKKTSDAVTTNRRGEIHIDNYLLVSFENYVDDFKTVDFKLNLNKVDIVIPA